jgi:hypothetical protein
LFRRFEVRGEGFAQVQDILAPEFVVRKSCDLGRGAFALLTILFYTVRAGPVHQVGEWVYEPIHDSRFLGKRLCHIFMAGIEATEAISQVSEKNEIASLPRVAQNDQTRCDTGSNHRRP